jgi:NodT family efflux transporter outer membrane factor (OMF) lipoprotein
MRFLKQSKKHVCVKFFFINKLGLVFIIASLLGVYSCVSLPQDQQTENLISPPSIDPSLQSGLNSGYFNQTGWPSENWWKIFHSPELNQFIALALDQNPSLSAIQRRVEFAKQTAKVVRSQLFPLLFFDYQQNWQYLSHNGLYRALNHKVPISGNLIDLSLSFYYEFDFWGKNRNLFQAALGETKAQEAEAADVQLIIATSVAQAFFALKTNLIRKKLYEELFFVRNQILDLQALLLNKSLLSQLEPLFSEEQVLEAEKWVFSLEEEVEIDRHLLNILLGRSPDTPVDTEPYIPPWQKKLSLPEDLSLNLIARRPDLMAQIWRVEALAHEVGAAKADFFPNINLIALAGLESFFYPRLFRAHSKTGFLQPAIHLPVFTAGAIRANIRAKKALFDQAVFDYNNLILTSAQEVADLIGIVKMVCEQKQDQEQIVAAAKARYELTALRVEKGLDNLLALYLVQEEWIQKQLEDVSLLYNQYLAAIKLIKSLGGGYCPEYSPPAQS